ncbi:MAG: inositol monophosphatase family protein [Candidatus Binatia bacterium]|nr:inositol monophosphatase family protein [Candidatus Binatia bacterium]
MSGYERELEAAIEIAESAGRLTLEHFGTALEVELKADESPVTIADRGAEQLIRKRLDEAFPEDGQLGEEFGEKAGKSGRRWIIDPIDGTQSFVRGVPLYGVLLGLEDEGRCVAGVMCFPPLSETYSAAAGGPAYRNGSVVRVDDETPLANATLLSSDIKHEQFGQRHADFDRLVHRVGRYRGWGDCYGYALVVSGRAQIMLDPLLNPWDIAAVLPILEAAGGRFVGWNGEAGIDAGSGIGTSAALHDEVRAILRVPAAANSQA